MGPNAEMPQNAIELYNMCHTKARNIIERAFAELKMRWAILRSASFYPIKTQVQQISACFLLHNYIRSDMPVDPLEDLRYLEWWTWPGRWFKWGPVCWLCWCNNRLDHVPRSISKLIVESGIELNYDFWTFIRNLYMMVWLIVDTQGCFLLFFYAARVGRFINLSSYALCGIHSTKAQPMIVDDLQSVIWIVLYLYLWLLMAPLWLLNDSCNGYAYYYYCSSTLVCFFISVSPLSLCFVFCMWSFGNHNEYIHIRVY